MKVTTLSRYLLIRAKTGVSDLGSEWPARAVMEPSTDRYALLFPHEKKRGSVIMKAANIVDSVARAQREVACNGAQSCAVARVSGKFGDSLLYEEVFRVSKDDAPSLKHAEEGVKEENRVKYWGASITSTVAMGNVEGEPIKISGMASTNSIDRDHEIVEETAFKEDLGNFLNNPLFLWNHSRDMPIGTVTEVEPVANGLEFTALVHDNQMKRWLERDMINSVSIGFRIKESEYREPEWAPNGELVRDGVMVIKRVELVEISMVTAPANADARFTVVKHVKSHTKDADVGGCTDQSPCVCVLPRGNVGYRSLPVADLDAPFDQESVGKMFGDEFNRHCHAFEESEGNFVLPTAAVVDGELKAVPILVRLSMAQIVARDHDMTDDQRQMAWSHVGKRWMDCYPEELVPAIDKLPSPGLFGKVLKGDLLEVPYTHIPDSVEQRWAEDRGLSTQKKSAAPLEGARLFELPRGVRVYIKSLNSKPAQMIVVSKSRFKKQADAEAWVKARGFSYASQIETEDSFKFPQFASAEGKAGTFDTNELEDGISAIVCERKERAMKTRTGIKAAEQEGKPEETGDEATTEEETATKPEGEETETETEGESEATEEGDQSTEGDSAEDSDAEVEVDTDDIAALEAGHREFKETGSVSNPAEFEQALTNVGEAIEA